MKRTDHPPCMGTPLARDNHTSVAALSLAARLATETADALTTDRHTAGYPLTPLTWADALHRAHRTVLGDKPQIVANAVLVSFTEALPGLRLGETEGEYAIRLRAAAKGL